MGKLAIVRHSYPVDADFERVIKISPPFSLPRTAGRLTSISTTTLGPACHTDNACHSREYRVPVPKHVQRRSGVEPGIFGHLSP